MTIAPASLEKEARLKTLLSECGAVAVAYSGGVDSSYLADVATETLGEKALLTIADTPSLPREELAFALDLARQRGWRVEVIHPREFDNPAFLQNDVMRCYHCKSALFETMRHHAATQGEVTLVHGETADDAFDTTRVGAKAARERGVRALLAEAGLGKEDIRALSRARNLPTWNKPSFACLASRLPTGASISVETLARVEQAEATLRSLGFQQYRARHHGELCRIEVAPADFPRLLEPSCREQLLTALRGLGYRHVTLDLAGYRMGSTAG